MPVINDVAIKKRKFFTIFGNTSNGQSIPRDGAKIGECLYVSGILGLSKIGLDNFDSNLEEFLEAKKNIYFHCQE